MQMFMELMKCKFCCFSVHLYMYIYMYVCCFYVLAECVHEYVCFSVYVDLPTHVYACTYVCVRTLFTYLVI